MRSIAAHRGLFPCYRAAMQRSIRNGLLFLGFFAALAMSAKTAPALPSNPALQTAQRPKKVAISAGVAQGMLIQKVDPVYPPDAKAAKVQGRVTLRITINTEGTVEDLSVVSGPEMLRQAALDAVKQWHYKPYLLNGEPVAVDTIVNLIFTLADPAKK
jgi:TonB family protein